MSDTAELRYSGDGEDVREVPESRGMDWDAIDEAPCRRVEVVTREGRWFRITFECGHVEFYLAGVNERPGDFVGASLGCLACGKESSS